MNELKRAYNAYEGIKFWVIVGLIGVGSLWALPVFLGELTGGERGAAYRLYSVLVIALATVGVLIPVVVLRERAATNRFFVQLERPGADLEHGVALEDGSIVTWDTPLVRYQIVFSAIVLTTGFASRPQVVGHPTSESVRSVCTISTAVFGWWFLGLDGIVNTARALRSNSRHDNMFTLRQLAASSTA